MGIGSRKYNVLAMLVSHSAFKFDVDEIAEQVRTLISGTDGKPISWALAKDIVRDVRESYDEAYNRCFSMESRALWEEYYFSRAKGLGPNYPILDPDLTVFSEDEISVNGDFPVEVENMFKKMKDHTVGEWKDLPMWMYWNEYNTLKCVVSTFVVIAQSIQANNYVRGFSNYSGMEASDRRSSISTSLARIVSDDYQIYIPDFYPDEYALVYDKDVMRYMRVRSSSNKTPMTVRAYASALNRARSSESLVWDDSLFTLFSPSLFQSKGETSVGDPINPAVIWTHLGGEDPTWTYDQLYKALIHPYVEQSLSADSIIYVDLVHDFTDDKDDRYGAIAILKSDTLSAMKAPKRIFSRDNQSRGITLLNAHRLNSHFIYVT